VSTRIAKKKPVFQKGQLVYIRVMYGRNKGTVDEQVTYLIRNIGPKMCTLDRVDKLTRKTLEFKGRNLSLVDRTTAEARNNDNYWVYQAWDWSQLLVPLGAAGWDADCNF